MVGIVEITSRADGLSRAAAAGLNFSNSSTLYSLQLSLLQQALRQLLNLIFNHILIGIGTRKYSSLKKFIKPGIAFYNIQKRRFIKCWRVFLVNLSSVFAIAITHDSYKYKI